MSRQKDAQRGLNGAAMTMLPGDSVWLPNPEEHDFPAALSYLDLLWPDDDVDIAQVVAELRAAATIVKMAKDILRASRLELLPMSNAHVNRNIHKFHKGKLLSPVLLVRGNPLIIADGYHRICAAYHLTEDLEVPCRLVSPRMRDGIRSYAS
jgi:hypothetical protein